jgi:hypothetical protein
MQSASSSMQSNSAGRKADAISFEFDAIELGREKG